MLGVVCCYYSSQLMIMLAIFYISITACPPGTSGIKYSDSFINIDGVPIIIIMFNFRV